MAKYRNRKTAVEGRLFDSQAEAQHFSALRDLERTGVISDLCCQVRFTLVPTFRHGGKTYRSIVYVADFTYLEVAERARVIADVKGCRTRAFGLKWKLLLQKYGSDYDCRLVQV